MALRRSVLPSPRGKLPLSATFTADGSSLSTPLKGPSSHDLPVVGDRVALKDNSKTGDLLYLGPTAFKEGMWAGIAVDELYEGKHDGCVAGVRYFTCDSGKGIFVQADKIYVIERESAGDVGVSSSSSSSTPSHPPTVAQRLVIPGSDPVSSSPHPAPSNLSPAASAPHSHNAHSPEGDDHVTLLEAEIKSTKVSFSCQPFPLSSFSFLVFLLSRPRNREI